MLESARASMGMSKAELARRGRLPPETVRRLLTSNEANPHFSMVADLAAGRTRSFRRQGRCASGNAPAGPERVQAWLAHLGAPLYGSTAVDLADVPRPERVLAEALPLARREAAVSARFTRGLLSHAQASRLRRAPPHGSGTRTRTNARVLPRPQRRAFGRQGPRARGATARGGGTPPEARVAILQAAKRDGAAPGRAEDAGRCAALGFSHEHVGR